MTNRASLPPSCSPGTLAHSDGAGTSAFAARPAKCEEDGASSDDGASPPRAAFCSTSALRVGSNSISGHSTMSPYCMPARRGPRNSATATQSHMFIQACSPAVGCSPAEQSHAWFRVFDLREPSPVRGSYKTPLTAANWSVSALCLSPSGRLLALGAEVPETNRRGRDAGGEPTCHLQVYSVGRKRREGTALVWQSDALPLAVKAACWSPSSRRLATLGAPAAAGPSLEVTLWDASGLPSSLRPLSVSAYACLLSAATLSFSPGTESLLLRTSTGRGPAAVVYDDEGRPAETGADAGAWAWAGSRRLLGLTAGAEGGGQALVMSELAEAPGPATTVTSPLPPGIQPPMTLAVSPDHCRAAVLGCVVPGRPPSLGVFNLSGGKRGAPPRLEACIPLRQTGGSAGPAVPVLSWAPAGRHGHLLGAIAGGADGVTVVNTQARDMQEATTTFGPTMALSWSPCGDLLMISGANVAAAYCLPTRGPPVLRLEVFHIRLPRADFAGLGQFSFDMVRKLDNRVGAAEANELGRVPVRACPALAIRNEDGYFRAAWLLPDASFVYNFEPIFTTAGPPVLEPI